MKKSELKRHIKEALTPDEASKVDSKYKEIYSGMLKNNPLKLKKYDNPDAVAYGRAIKLIQKESAKMLEKKLTAAEKDKKEDIIMSLKKQKGGKDKLKPADYAIATSQAKKLAEDGEEIAKKNMDMYKDKNRLTELIKAALMGPISEKKQRPDYPDIDGDGDTEEPMVKAAKDKEKAEANESFDSLVKKVDKAKGYTKKEAEKVAGAIAAKKMKGAGKGPTAKQKKRMAETILKELRGSINEMAGEDLELKSLAKKMIPTLKKSGFEVEYSTDTSMKTLKNAGDKFVALRVQDGMLGAHIPHKSGLDAAKEVQKLIQKSLGNEFEYSLTTSKQNGLKFFTVLIRNK